MNIEQKLQKIKKVYLSIEAPRALSEDGWAKIEKMLDESPLQEKTLPFVWFRMGAFLALLLFIFGVSFFAFAHAVQGALPGQPLYPLRKLAEKVVVQVTGNKEAIVEKRAQDVIRATKKDNPDTLKDAVKEYKETVVDAKKDIEKSAQKEEEFKKQLEKQESEFKRASEENSSRKQRLEDAVKAAQEGQNGKNQIEIKKNPTEPIKQEVKGESTNGNNGKETLNQEKKNEHDGKLNENEKGDNKSQENSNDSRSH